ncbi:uncharacterized protein BJ212DRAFT_228163 [Suillus subaureus]|uniref:Uncharacterized protein n=1 Tax=Suillus subaureus TaxID=48587 RepID=A0A9P7JD14_9AGAM|nr:uncharacterized protein BJ212DRAFT_228163 [Suillus subaureus]KAG1815587.1 hypothetical protein BJ212DRAFT_228163 [Suillus subaureus]
MLPEPLICLPRMSNPWPSALSVAVRYRVNDGDSLIPDEISFDHSLRLRSSANVHTTKSSMLLGLELSVFVAGLSTWGDRTKGGVIYEARLAIQERYKNMIQKHLIQEHDTKHDTKTRYKNTIQNEAELHEKHDMMLQGKMPKDLLYNKKNDPLCSMGVGLECLMIELGSHAIEWLWGLAYFSRYAAISIEQQPGFLTGL